MARHVLVCVTGQRGCARLIQAGLEITEGQEGMLSVLHVAKRGQFYLGNADESAAIEYLYQVSRENGADMTCLRSDDVPTAIAQCARRAGADVLVMGMSRGGRKSDGASLSLALQALLPDVEIRELPTSGD